jgi:hypothetical protein
VGGHALARDTWLTSLTYYLPKYLFFWVPFCAQTSR